MNLKSDLNAVILAALCTMLAANVFAGPAHAEQPVNWQLGFQSAASPVMEEINRFHNLLLLLITFIVLFVLALLVTVAVRFNSRSNPAPSATTHNTAIEVIWTVAPIFILLAIAVPSFRLLYAEDVAPEAEMTLKLTGNQWYWTVAYPDQQDITYDVVMLEDADRPAGAPRLLAVDNDLVAPVDTTIRVIVTAADVIHAFAMPAMGVKIDAVPGQLNETWFKATREGIFYGQCSELCGSRHAFMPLALRVVGKQAFKEWAEAAKLKYATAPAPSDAGMTQGPMNRAARDVALAGRP